MAIITIVGSGMMGSALAFPARENQNTVRIVGTHLDRAIIESCRHTNQHPKFTRPFPEGIRFYHEWSEYMLSADMKELAAAPEGSREETTLKKEEAPEEDGTLRYVLLLDGTEAAECRILPMAEGNRCYLFGLETKPELRNRGMATGLMAKIAKEYAGKPDGTMLLQVSSKNVPAERLYRKLGFVTVEEREYYRTEVSDGK